MRKAIFGKFDGKPPIFEFFPPIFHWFLHFPPQLLKTGDDVAKMQEELETMKPLLEEAAVETASTMEQIEKDTVSKNNAIFL